MTAKATQSPLHTVCIGRHLIDVPAAFALMPGGSAIFTPPGLSEQGGPIHLTVRALELGRAQFQAALAQRRSELEAAQRPARRRLEQVIPFGDDATLFRVREVGQSYKDELHLWKGGSHLVVATASYEDSYQQAEERLLAFAANIEPLPANGRGAGFCLGPVLVKGEYVGEYASVGFRGKTQADVIVSIELDTYAVDESEPLRERVASPDALLRKFQSKHKVMREGELMVAGMHAQEWLGWIKLGAEGNRKEYGFAMETMRPVPGERQPRIHLALDSGQSGPNGESFGNSLDDQSALALWDSLVRTIRRAPEP